MCVAGSKRGSANRWCDCAGQFSSPSGVGLLGMEGMSVSALLLMHEVRRCLVQPHEGSVQTSGVMLLDSLIHLSQLLECIWMVFLLPHLPYFHVDIEVSM